nr:hypothetical protein [Spirochaetota bacterium]
VLLPAVYLSYPELIDLKPAAINPTVESMHRGMLQVQPDGQNEESVVVIMPDMILDRKRMMEILEAGWRKAWDRESSGWKQS